MQLKPNDKTNLPYCKQQQKKITAEKLVKLKMKYGLKIDFFGWENQIKTQRNIQKLIYN